MTWSIKIMRLMNKTSLNQEQNHKSKFIITIKDESLRKNKNDKSCNYDILSHNYDMKYQNYETDAYDNLKS